MKRSLLLVLLLAAALGTAERPRVTRVALATMEKTFDQRVLRFDLNDPFDLLGTTRGVYLEGYGAAFTAEVNLVASAAITPFRPAPDREQIERLRQKKLERVTVLKKYMREMLLNLAASLEAVPPGEQIALGVSVFYFSWEDRSGLPAQILMQARRQTLLDLARKGASDRTLEGSVRLEEF